MKGECVPNLWGASPVSRDDGGLPYAARSFSSGKPKWRQRGHGSGVDRLCEARRTVATSRVMSRNARGDP